MVPGLSKALVEHRPSRGRINDLHLYMTVAIGSVVAGFERLGLPINVLKVLLRESPTLAIAGARTDHPRQGVAQIRRREELSRRSAFSRELVLPMTRSVPSEVRRKPAGQLILVPGEESDADVSY